MPSIINATTTNGVAVSGDTSGALALQTNNGTTALTIDTAQNVSTVKDVTINGVTVGKGAGSGSNNVAVGSGALQANTTASNNTAVGYQAGYSNTTGAANVLLGIGAGYSNTVSSNNVFCGINAGYSFNGATATTFNTFVGPGAGYFVTTGTNNTILGGYPGNFGGLDIRTASNYIVLSDGVGNPRIVVDNTGHVAMGYIPQLVGGNYLSLIANNEATLASVRYGADGNHITFWNSTGVLAGNINVSGLTTTYNSVSDYRLKENVVSMTGALAKVEALNPVTYDWKHDGSAGQGFIAHELQAIIPDAVVGTKDQVDEDGKPIYQAIDTSVLVATLTAAIKEQQAIIESLKTRIEVLENK